MTATATLVTAGVVTAVNARAATGCRVQYTVTNQWQGGFGANVNLTNLGDPVTSWRVTWTFGAGQTVTQLWNGSVSQSGSAVAVTNVSYNGTLAANATTAFGFNGAWNGSNPVPTSFAMNGTTCTGTTTGGSTSAAPTSRPPATTTTPATSRPPATTAGPGSSCGVNPVDPDATASAKRLLCYLYSQYGNHILSGQQESVWMGSPDYEMNIIRSASGKLPAIRGSDQGDSKDWGSRGLAWWNAGGIPMVGYHMGATNQGTDGYSGSRMRGNITAALTAGTADNGRLNTRLNEWIGQLKIIQNGGGAVLFRPWHEASGTWFWWSMEGAALYNRLWIYTYNYMRAQGVHNLVYLHPFNGSPNSAWYPGRQYVDIGGADTYAGDHGPLTSMYNACRNVYGTSMPIALHENGRIPDPAQLQSAGSRWVLFNTWHTTFISDTSINPTSFVNTVYNSSYVVTRDEVPNLR
ncbi:hypothetical protein GCM10009682_10310 [Luedemannella flava]|uniref:Mannan endo-1,4-beta-mannosidase n=1 Tax=Luedemannella flava TaxID=349316 RepID=A0ABN2LIX5_9ACTN